MSRQTPSQEFYHTVGIPVNEPLNYVKPDLPWFIFKVLNIVFLQLLITGGISVTAYYYKEPLLSYCQHDKGIILIPIVLSFASLCLLSCAKNNRIIACFLLTIFTLSIASLLAIGILPYSPVTLVKAVTGTTVSVLIINSYAYYCAKKNVTFNSLGPILFGGLIGIIVMGFLQMFVQSTIFGIFISIISMGLFSVYLLYDLNRLYNRTDDYEDDAIMVAINLYLDIINMFVSLLEIIQVCESRN